MDIVYPQKIEGQVWHTKFQESLGAWLQSQRRDSGAFSSALDALRNQLEREPRTAGFVANLISALVQQHQRVLTPVLLARAANRGLDAIRLVSEPSPLRTTTRASLLNHLALAYLRRGLAGDALDQVELALQELDDDLDEEGVVSFLLAGQARLIAGRACEGLLDYTTALLHFDGAFNAASHIIEDEDRLSHALRAVIELDFPNVQLPDVVLKAQLNLLWTFLCEIRIAASAGGGRCAVLVDRGSLPDRLRQIADVSETNGLIGITPLELATQIGAASPELAREVTGRLFASVERLDLDTGAFRAVLTAALTMSAEGAMERARYAELAEGHVRAVDDPIIRAATYGLLLTSADRSGARQTYLEAFLDELDTLDVIRDERLASPENRIVFDEPVSVALLEVCKIGDGLVPWSKEHRTRVAKLIDYDFVRSTPLDDWLPEEVGSDEIDVIRDLLRDRLARAQTALKKWPKTMGLVLRTIEDRTLFIAMDGERAPVAVITGPEYSEATQALAEHIDDEIGAIELTHSAGPVEVTEGYARSAFDALPDVVRAMIREAAVVLVCPDHRVSGGAVPFELFHDGTNWLGTSHEVARFPNLRTLVRCLEGTSHRDEHRRLLAIAVPEAEGFPPLRFASREAEHVRMRLEADKWDAPPINSDRVTPDFLLERLAYTTHLHLAAHGEARGPSESVVLHHDQRLSGAMLLGQFFPRMPTAYINACELGTSRWAGSGRAQSIPYALLSAGSRAVVTNLMPVEDQMSSDFASAFYAAAPENGFGFNLREARRRMHEQNVHPVFWGTTVLVGDPRASLAPREEVVSLSQRYLDALIPLSGGERNDEALREVPMKYLTEPDDVRLRAGVEFARAIQEWSPELQNYDFADICTAARSAFELEHRGWLALLISMAHQSMDDSIGPEEEVHFYDNAIKVVEPLQNDDELWRRILDQLLVAWLRAVRGDRMPELRVSGPEDEDGGSVRAVQAMMDIQLAIEARNLRDGRGPVARTEEATVEDVLWNAVMASREYQFEGMSELFDYARLIVDKLLRFEALPGQSSEEAATAFAGTLNWIWRSQNLAQLAEEMISGQTGVLTLLVDSLSTPWKRRAWFKPCRQFAAEMVSALESLEGLPYDDKLYPRIEEVMTEIRDKAESTLCLIEEHHPEQLCAANAWILGSLIQHNTYSYVDGSVWEHVEESLREVQYGLDAHAEGRFYPWLMEGFKAVREANMDELQRWKYGFPPLETAAEEDSANHGA